MSSSQHRYSAKTFLRIALIYFGSFMGTNLTGFALGLWAYHQSNSVLIYSLTLLATLAPQVSMAPILGVWIDRLNKKHLLYISQIVPLLNTFVLLALFLQGNLQIWQVIAYNCIASVFMGLGEYTLQTSVTTLVPKEKLSWAEGIARGGFLTGKLFAPAMAAVIYVLDSGMLYLIAFDIITYFIAIAALLIISLPSLMTTRKIKTDDTKAVSTSGEILFAWRYIKERKGLLALTLYFFLNMIGVGISQAVTPPFVLTFAGEVGLGFIMAMAGFGMVFGTAMVMIRKNTNRKIKTLIISYLISGSIAMLIAAPPTIIGIGIISALYFGFTLYGTTCVEVLWKQKIPVDIQGRIIGLKTGLTMSGLPIGLLIAGPLADSLFEPMMMPGGFLADSVGSIMGTGVGRGMALLLCWAGFLRICMTLFAAAYPPFYRLEHDLQDATPSDTVIADADAPAN